MSFRGLQLTNFNLFETFGFTRRSRIYFTDSSSVDLPGEGAFTETYSRYHTVLTAKFLTQGDQNAGRSYSMKIYNTTIERLEEFKYLGTTLTNKNCIQEEIKSRLKLGNACYYSVLNLLSSSLLSRKLKIYITIILPVVLYGCETWSLTLREERRLRVFENKALRRVFGAKKDEVTGEWIMRSLVVCTRYPILWGW